MAPTIETQSRENALPGREQLAAENRGLKLDNHHLKQENQWLREKLNLTTRKVYGASSERTPHEQESLFNEAEAVADASAPEPDPALKTPREKRAKNTEHFQAQLAVLPVSEMRHELPAAERFCPQCAGPLHEIGAEAREKVELVPAHLVLVKHLQIKYACRHCACHGTGVPVVSATLPKTAFPKSLASPSLVAHVMSQKFELALPLYRQEQHFGELGLDVSRQTLCNWVLTGSSWLYFMYARLHQLLLGRDILHADETRVQVLREPERAAQDASFMWLYRTGRELPAIVLYDYQTTRGSANPRGFLEGYQGFLHVDGYAAYERLPGVTTVGCWAHARRKFDEALKVLPPKSRAGADSAARHGLERINKLFAIERELHDAEPAARLAARLARSQPLLDELRAWLAEQAPRALPKSHLGQAIAYSLNQWPKLTMFLQDGRLEIDNNRCERSIKPFVIGRKNWLFANTPNGAQASAMIYSIVETAKENRIGARAYLEYLFERLPNIDKTDTAALDALLPWSPAVKEACGAGPPKPG